MKINIFNFVLFGFFFFSYSLAAQPRNVGIPSQNVSIYENLVNEFVIKSCSFPPKDIQNFDFIKLCNELMFPTDNAGVESDELGYLCMGFYDISLRLCGEEKKRKSNYIFATFSDLNATIYSSMSQENISVEGEVNRTQFCKKMPITNTTYTQTMRHMIILNKALRNQKYCEHLCFTFTGRLNPLCGIMFWGNNMLIRTHLNESKHENAGKHAITPKEKVKVDVNDNSKEHANGEKKNDNNQEKSQLPGKSAPEPVATGQITEHKVENNSTENSNKPLTDDKSKGSIKPSINSTHSSDPAENRNLSEKAEANLPSDSNNGNTSAQDSKLDESKLKTGTSDLVQPENTASRDKDGQNEILNDRSTTSTVSADYSGDVQDPEGPDVELSQQEQPSDLLSQQEQPVNPSSQQDQPSIPLSHQEQPSNPLENQLDSDPSSKISNPNKQGQIQIVTNDPVSKGSESIASYGDQINNNEAGDGTQNSMKGTQARGMDGFSETEDSHFFLYFSSMIVMCTIMYILFHNKNKILALALEGRKHRPRPPKKDGYMKVDNLEEAMASPLNKSVTNIIY